MIKILFTSSTLLLAYSCFGQLPAKGRYIPIAETQENSGNLRETVIWEETFENGIPGNWTNLGSPNLAIWEYRGPSTTPDLSIGTRGSCIPEGQLGGAPIDSETADNGFIIFDSNYWDDPEGPCGNFGSGPAPGPHSSSITTPGINLNGYFYVGLRFHQYTKNFNAIHKIQISLNGQPFFDVYTQNLGFNEETLRDDILNVNLTNYAANQSNVRVRFLFEGSYYFWMIDDVQLIELDPYDLEINNETYGDFDINNPDHPTGFEFLEYTMYPQAMAPELKFSANISNQGGEVIQGVQLNSVLNRTSAPAQEIYSGYSEGILLQPGSSEVLRAGNYTMEAIQGTYEVVFEAISLEEDVQPSNNSSTKSFEITNGIYARDARGLEGVYVPAPDEQNIPFEIGNIFLITSANQALYSVECGLSLGTLTGAEVYGAIYEFDLNIGVTATLLAQTPVYTVAPEDLNGAGEEKMKLLSFDSPVLLQQGHAYAVVMGANAGAPDVICAISGAVPELSSWIHFPSQEDWFFLSYAPMVRMNFLDPDGVIEVLDRKRTMEVWPNPTNNLIFINQDSFVQLDVYSMNGDLVKVIEPELMSGSLQIQLHDCNAGQYLIKGIRQDGTMAVANFIIN